MRVRPAIVIVTTLVCAGPAYPQVNTKPVECAVTISDDLDYRLRRLEQLLEAIERNTRATAEHAKATADNTSVLDGNAGR